MEQIKPLELGLHERLQRELSSYPVKMVQVDGTVSVQHERNPYFLVSDIWSISSIGAIPQFQKMINKYKGTDRNIQFQINSPSVNLEVNMIDFYIIQRSCLKWLLHLP